jgi:hypothetical protein
VAGFELRTNPAFFSRFREAGLQAHARAQEDCLREARRKAPVSVSRGAKLNSGSVQGGLRASLTGTTPIAKGEGTYSQMGSAARHFLMREFGGVIVPVRAKVLAWQDPVTGEWIHAKRVVQRPGGPRQGNQPFMGPAVKRFPEFAEAHLRELYAGL